MVGEEKQCRERLKKYFPDITPSNSRCTSPATYNYNCIAWAYEKENLNVNFLLLFIILV